MNIVEKATIIHYHRHRIREYASGTVEALGYRGDQSQCKRFEVLSTVANLNGCSILDVGCGHGDLKDYLDGKFHGFSYIGIDQMAEFIAQARSLYGQRPSCYFSQADFTTADLPQVDYVFASGVLAYRCTEKNFYFAMIEKMYQAANKALVFNMLDAERFPQHELLIGHDPERVMAFCNTLSKNVQLIRGYLEDDFTVMIKRGEGNGAD